MSAGRSDDVGRLRAAIEAHECFLAEGGSKSAEEFLAKNEQYRDLLEPLLAPRPPSATTSTGQTRILGDFRLLGELGRGGMGIVYEAEQMSLRRIVAVKVLPRNLSIDPSRRRRFVRESRLAARLDHPGIAKVLSAAIEEDVTWYAMERIEGAPLDRVLRESSGRESAPIRTSALESLVYEVACQHRVKTEPRPTAVVEAAEKLPKQARMPLWESSYGRTVARIGEQLALALHYAHIQGVVHRDVKPANILLQRDGWPVLTDFGLARNLNDPSMTRSGEYLGTPAYSAPEQINATATTVDHRVDIFALGITLYELLTRKHPFAASSTSEIRSRILSDEAPRIRRHRPEVSRDLQSVVLKALEKDPQKRYSTAAAFAADLRAAAIGQTVRARPVRSHTRVLRWCRRNPWVALVLVLLNVVVALLVTFRAVSNRHFDQQFLQAGRRLARTTDFEGALDLLIPVETRLSALESTAAFNELFWRHPCLSSSLLVHEEGESIVSARFSPDGSWMQTCHEYAKEPRRGKCRVVLWSIPSLGASQPRQIWSKTFDTVPAMLIPDSEGNSIWKSSPNTVGLAGLNVEESFIAVDGPIDVLVRTTNPRRFGVQNALQILEYRFDGTLEGAWTRPLRGSASRSSGGSGTMCIVGNLLCWVTSDDQSWQLEYCAADGEIRLAGLISKELKHGCPSMTVAIHRPGTITLRASDSVTTWILEQGSLRLQRRVPRAFTRAAFRTSLSWTIDDDVDSWDRFDSFPARAFRGSWVYVPPSIPDKSPCIVVVDQKTARLWLPHVPRVVQSGMSGLELALFNPYGTNLLCGGCSELNSTALSEGTDTHPETLQNLEWSQPGRSSRSPPSVCGVASAPDGTVLACADYKYEDGRSGRLFILDPDKAAPTIVDDLDSTPTWLELSPSGRLVAMSMTNTTVEVREYRPQDRTVSEPVVLPKGAPDAVLPTGELVYHRLSCVRFISDRFLIATVGGSNTPGGLLLWDLDAEQSPPRRIPFPRALRCLAVADNGSWIATGGDDHMLRILSLTGEGEAMEVEQKHSLDQGAPVYAVAFAQQSDRLLVAAADKHGGVGLWDVETGQSMGQLRETDRESIVMSLDVSPDRRTLAAGTSEGEVLLWDLDFPQRCLDGNRQCAQDLRKIMDEER